MTRRRRTSTTKRSGTRRPAKSAKRPAPERRPFSILEAEWDGLSVEALCSAVLKDHRNRKRDRLRYINPWDQRLVCRYVLRGMALGFTESTLLEPLGMEYFQFLRFLRLEFLVEEYHIARKYQARAFADLAHSISQGTDPHSERIARRIDNVLRNEFRRAIRRSKKHKDSYQLAQDILEVKREIKELDRNLLARNKLMVDTNRWMARTNDPDRYSERSNVAVGASADPSGTPAVPLSLTIRFVSPSGKTVIPGGKAT